MKSFGNSPRKIFQNPVTGRFVKPPAHVAEPALIPSTVSQSTRAELDHSPPRRKRTLRDKIRRANKRKKSKQ